MGETFMNTVSIEFESQSSGRGPLIWAQEAMWLVLRWLPTGDTSTNFAMTSIFASPQAVEDVLAATREILERHDALHTFFVSEDDVPQQVVSKSGTVQIELHELAENNVEDATAKLAERACGIPFNVSSDLPIRFYALAVGNRITSVVMVFSHLAADLWSARIVHADFEAFVAGTELPPRAQQPLERAAYERSEQGRRAERQALEYWSTAARELPSVWLSDLRDGQRAQLVTSEITSPALAVAARAAATAAGLTTTMVLQAAMALLLAIHHGENDVAVRLVVATRFRQETQKLVAAFNLNALLRLQVVDESFDQFLIRARTAALVALSRCECSPRTLEPIVQEIAQARGFRADGYCFFNDVSDRPALPGLPLEQARSAVNAVLDRTVVAEHETLGDPKGAKFFLYLRSIGEDAVLTLCVDRRFMSRPSAFLKDLEWLLVTAVQTGAGPVELADRWRRRDH
jgi:hypothetical protein